MIRPLITRLMAIDPPQKVHAHKQEAACRPSELRTHNQTCNVDLNVFNKAITEVHGSALCSITFCKALQTAKCYHVAELPCPFIAEYKTCRWLLTVVLPGL